MFTGIVEEIGTVREVGRGLLVLEAHEVLEGTKVGDSIAVNGVCLTVVSLEGRCFTMNVMPETLRRTDLGGLRYGDKVNLERALIPGGRLGGHFVQGHVEDTGMIMSIRSDQAARIVRVSAPRGLMRYIVAKGFVAVDGASLTVTDLDDSSFSVSLVAYTMGHTTLEAKRPGDMVNLETDILAKYVENLRERKGHTMSSEFLREYGFVGGVDAG
jgi:riboflavin synthase